MYTTFDLNSLDSDVFPDMQNIKGRGKKDDQEEFQEILFKSLFSTWGWWWTSMVVFT